MSVKDILVFLDESSASNERLRLAMNVAKEHHACLSAAFSQDDRTPEMAINVGLARFPAMGDQPAHRAPEISPGALLAETTERHFNESIRSLHVEGDWSSLTKDDVAGAITLARAADIVIMGQVNPNARTAPGWRPEEIVVACGRPVLMVPYVGDHAQIGRRVLIAWDGSQEAVRAINDALPMISAADTVTVLTVYSRAKDLERDHRALERIERHLARHGLNVRTDHTVRAGNTVTDALLSRAFDMSADLIVAGAYHHSPLREALIGGISRELLQFMTVPVLMSH
jgi:nucleotide-binding universal stress UspA family protein